MKRSKIITLTSLAALTAAGAAAAQDAEWSRAMDNQQMTSLDVTVDQVEDSDLVNADREELGEVEQVLLDEAGEATGVLVELEDDYFDKERFVVLKLSDLTVIPDEKGLFDDGDEINLLTSMTIDQLASVATFED